MLVLGFSLLFFGWLIIVIGLVVEQQKLALCGFITFIVGIFIVISSGEAITDIETEMRAKNNMSLEDVKIIDSGDVFKYDGKYYIRTKNNEILLIDRRYSNAVYEHN